MSEVTTEVKEEVQLTETEQQVKTVTDAVAAGRIQLPEKFKGDVAAWVKSYTELQGHATKLAQENAELKKATPPVKGEVKEPTDLASQLEADKADQGEENAVWDNVTAELVKTGGLSDETKKMLTSTHKIPAAVIEATIEGHKAKVAKDVAEAEGVVGGKDKLNAVLAWSKENLSESDRNVVQEQLRGPGWKLALMGLNTMYQSAQTKEPTDRDFAQGGGTTQAQAFGSQKEMNAAVRDPRYAQRTDMKYVKEVEARIYATTKAQKVK